MRKSLAIAAIVLLAPYAPFERSASACTIGVAAGSVTADGRPLLWKSRGSAAYNFVVFVEGASYDYIGVKDASNEGVMMGLNSAGLATGNAMVSSPGTHPHSVLQADILGGCVDVDAAYSFIETAYNNVTLVASTNLPLIDADGAAAMVEVWCELPVNGGQHHLYYYDALNANRQNQPAPLGDMLGWIVRANEWHYHSNHRDNSTVYNQYGRYYDGVQILRDLLDPNTPTDLSAWTIMWEFIRSNDIAVSNVSSAITVQGVLPAENPGLSTMWTALGHSDYAIAAPLWVEAGYIPGPMAELQAPDEGSLLANLADDMDYYNFNVQTTQASVLPLEQHFFDEVAELMTRWRQDFALASAHMPRVQEAFATNAYRLLQSIYDYTPHSNHAPEVEIYVSCVAPDLSSAKKYLYPLYRFDADAADAEGDIVHYRWDFGDDSDCNVDAPTVYHRYIRSGWYLVSCTVEDEHSAQTTDFIYLHNVSLANETPAD